MGVKLSLNKILLITEHAYIITTDRNLSLVMASKEDVTKFSETSFYIVCKSCGQGSKVWC